MTSLLSTKNGSESTLSSSLARASGPATRERGGRARIAIAMRKPSACRTRSKRFLLVRKRDFYAELRNRAMSEERRRKGAHPFLVNKQFFFEQFGAIADGENDVLDARLRRAKNPSFNSTSRRATRFPP